MEETMEAKVEALKPKPEYLDDLTKYCMSTNSKNPVEIFIDLTSMPCFGMMGVHHHFLVASALLTAYKNCGNDIDLEAGLIEIQERAKNVPPMACMKLGCCGAAVSAGMFISVAKGVSLDSNEFFGTANGMTSKVLDKIGKIGGPRCCKRHSYLSLQTAVVYANEHLATNMETSKIICKRSSENNLCIKDRCPFHNN